MCVCGGVGYLESVSDSILLAACINKPDTIIIHDR